MLGARALSCFLLGSLAVIGTARAEPSIQEVPDDCRPYTWIPADARDDLIGWNQLLSLASCLQGGSIAPVTDSDELDAMIDRETRALEIPMMIYAAALEDGPGPVQVRAAYQLGMAHVALIIRARTAIAASARTEELRAELETLLAPSDRLAWLTFAVIDRAVARDPALAPDPVTQNMVRSARAMLKILPKARQQSNEGAKTASGEPMQ